MIQTSPIALHIQQLDVLCPYYLITNQQGEVTTISSAWQASVSIKRGSNLSLFMAIEENEPLHALLPTINERHKSTAITWLHEPNIKHQVNILRSEDQFIWAFQAPVKAPLDPYITRDISQQLLHLSLDDFLLEDEKVIQNNTSVGALQQKLLDVKDKLKQLGLIEVKSFTPKVLMNEYAEVIWVNDAWEQYTGYTLDDVRGIQPGDLLYGADTIPDARETTNEKLSNKQIFSFESILYNKAKEPFWTRVILEPIVDGNGVLIGQMATMEDIAEAKRLEAEFKEQELLWKVTMEETGHGFWETDFRNNKYYFSRQLKSLLGYEDEDAFDLSTWQAALSPADRQYLEDTVLASLTEASPRFATEIKLGTKSGNNKFYLLKGRVLDWDEYKKPRRIAGTLMDINERMAKDIELRRTSATLKALLKNLNEGVLLVDEHEHIIVANEAFAELFQTEINADDLEGVDSNLVFEGGGSRYFEQPEEQEARTIAILENKLKVVAEQLQLTNGEIIERDFIPIFVDEVYMGHMWKMNVVTEQLAYKQKLEEQKDFYETIFNEIPADISIIDGEGKLIFVNRMAKKNGEMPIWQKSKKQRTSDFSPHLTQRQQYFVEALKSHNAIKYIQQRQDNAGGQYYILRNFYPFVSPNKEVNFVIGYGIDITEQVKNEQYAELQEGRIRNLLDIIKDAVFRCDDSGAINLINKSFKHIMGIGSDQEAESLNFFQLLPPDTQHEIKKKLKILNATGYVQTGTFHIPSNNQSTKYIEYSLSMPAKAEKASFIGRLSDITEVVLKEENLEKIIAKEKELNYSKSQFIRITSHELRTPLSIIMVNAEILEMAIEQGLLASPTFDSRKLAVRIIKEVNLMTEILNQLMLISKIETGNMEFQREVVDIIEYIHDITDDLYAPHSDGRTLVIESHTDAELAYLDKKIFRHAIVNLVNNAFKYSANKAAPVLRIKNSQEYTIIEVQDFGIGIPESELAQLCTAFFRASNVGVINGTGIGLMVVEYALNRHEGAMEVRSVVNEGTVFTLKLKNEAYAD